MAGAQTDEIGTTLLTFEGISDRLVWSEQYRESAVACQAIPVRRLGIPYDCSGRKQMFLGTGARRVHVAKPGNQVEPAVLATGGLNMHARPSAR